MIGKEILFLNLLFHPDLHQPLHPFIPYHAGEDGPQREAVQHRQWLAVHLVGQEVGSLERIREINLAFVFVGGHQPVAGQVEAYRLVGDVDAGVGSFKEINYNSICSAAPGSGRRQRRRCA
jgi:hypothetical protein